MQDPEIYSAAPTEPTTETDVDGPGTGGPDSIAMENLSTEGLLEFLRLRNSHLVLTSLDLPRRNLDAEQAGSLEQAMETATAYVDLSVPEAIQEFLNAPLFLAATRLVGKAEMRRFARLPPVDVFLHGRSDYLIRSESAQVLIETRHTDLEKGFAHLALQMELQSEDIGNDKVPTYGILATNGVWRFGVHTQSAIVADLNLFSIPRDGVRVVEHLVSLLTEAYDIVSPP